jgi:hypothetical protein
VKSFILFLLLLGLSPLNPSLSAQAPGVIVHEDSAYKARILKAARALHEKGSLVPMETLQPQLTRSRCDVRFGAPKTRILRAEEVYDQARNATLSIGKFYRCMKCDKWHTQLAGGYAVTVDGVAATCFHVLESDEEMRDAALIAADAEGNVYPVLEVLAANRGADVVLLRTAASGCRPLALNEGVRPGDRAFCLSNPKELQGFFSLGHVSRFYRHHTGPKQSGGAVFLHVTTDWAAGSSGAAVLDEYGNAIGHVASTRTLLWRDEKPQAGSVQMTLKQAASAAEVRALGKNPDL